jgi:hypothetical protein
MPNIAPKIDAARSRLSTRLWIRDHGMTREV